MLLTHYFVSTTGAVILNRDVEAFRSVATLSGYDDEIIYFFIIFSKIY